MIEARDKGNGPPHAFVACDMCGEGADVTCDYTRKPNGTFEPNEGQINKKMTGKGWSIVKGHLFCPDCEANRKVVKMPDPKGKDKGKDAAPREPTREQRRLILMGLENAYDVSQECYRSDYTDKTLADELGEGIMPGWVAQLRDENYGPAGRNEEMADVARRIEELGEEIKAEVREANKDIAQRQAARDAMVQRKLAEVSALAVRVEKVEASVDMRVRTR